MANTEAAISIEPIAPSECPTIDLIELTGIRTPGCRGPLESSGLVPVVLLGSRTVRVDVVDAAGSIRAVMA